MLMMKAVFGVEYLGQENNTDFCSYMNSLNYDWLWKDLDLDAWVVQCRTYPPPTHQNRTCF